MDLSKAFDTINHDLLIAKLYAYGIRGNSLKLLKNYLSNRFQRTKVEGKFSTWEELLSGVPEGLVLRPLNFNIYLNDLFYVVEYTDICNFADDTSPHSSSTDIDEAISKVEHDCLLRVSRGKRPIRRHLYVPKGMRGVCVERVTSLVTKVTSDDVTMMT